MNDDVRSNILCGIDYLHLYGASICHWVFCARPTGCGGKAAKEGGRINFDAGASISCIRRGLEKVRSGNNLSPGDQA
ncbi:MAG: hypothetical protein ACPGTU_09385, partial [Myxococcota bacterium]